MATVHSVLTTSNLQDNFVLTMRCGAGGEVSNQMALAAIMSDNVH